ncbi:alkaline phosphatase family protein [Pseudomonas sp. NPDC086278]|uniref:alkaline phosphatase family protein n=1 Tax=Pseudomonas sp. NPDC086278 TaxID=3390646 RepID=UPI003CFC94B2
MLPINRRNFLKASATTALAAGSFVGLPASIRNALASIDPTELPTSLAGIEHVVIFMQENRSYDHYFATLPGGRGIFDPRPAPLPTGKSAFFQTKKSDPTTHYAPFKFKDVYKENTYTNIKLVHDWAYNADWKNWDIWFDNRDPDLQGTHGYLDKDDIPFYYALAQNFTLCDNYHCSLYAGTNINRRYLWSGTSGAGLKQAIDYKQSMYIVYNDDWEANVFSDVDRDSKESGWKWETYADILERNNVSWKCYQGLDHYGDNGLAYFDNFRNSGKKDKSAAELKAIESKIKKARTYAGSTAETGKSDSPYDQYYSTVDGAKDGNKVADISIDEVMKSIKRDLETKDSNGKTTFPAVSWVTAPLKYCEHPSSPYSASAGQAFTERLLTAITDSPEVWAKTVIFITYDENDGYFDHVPAPLPPLAGKHNLDSNVENDTKEQYFSSDARYTNTNPNNYLGLGPRVPMLVISPLSNSHGEGRISSQLFDHTSVIRFLEDWLTAKGHEESAVKCNNISEWRRAACGNLVSTLDFSQRAVGKPLVNEAITLLPTELPIKKTSIPKNNTLPEFSAYEGKRLTVAPIACAMPFHCSAWGVASGPNLSINYTVQKNSLENLAATFITYEDPGLNTQTPHHIAVSAKRALVVDFEIKNKTDGYQYSIYGDNGFYRFFSGRGDDDIEVKETLQNNPKSLALEIKNTSGTPQVVKVDMDNTYHNVKEHLFYLVGGATKVITLSMNEENEGQSVFSLTDSHGWYNLKILALGEKSDDGGYMKGFYRALAGNIESLEGRVDSAIGYYREDVCNSESRPNAKDNTAMAKLLQEHESSQVS